MDHRGEQADGSRTRDAVGLPDAEVVRRVRDGEAALFEVLMRRYNQRLYRAARSIVKDEDEAEDVMQQAYVNAFQHLDQFAGQGELRHLAHPHRRARGPGAPAAARPGGGDGSHAERRRRGRAP